MPTHSQAGWLLSNSPPSPTSLKNSVGFQSAEEHITHLKSKRIALFPLQNAEGTARSDSRVCSLADCCSWTDNNCATKSEIISKWIIRTT
ncbi:hypothetical protein IRJ41_009142 [Triplophysa rosa]|uniref:Uncharacterized protein n=1 Tax=Triplophysa rosa TaxID=992332 RepID=A0A9W7TWM9_TRIRA|nr:hypothetical protein IRJ41_009142 [Triplophysa rosa]